MNRNDRAITALVMIAHAMVHTYEMAFPIFVTIWLLEFETLSLGFTSVAVNEATLGVVLTIGYGLFGLGALPGGVLVDRIGSRQLITACLAGMGGSYLLLGLSPSLLAVAAAIVLWGVAASVYHPAGLSLISKGVHERGTGFAYHGIAGNLGIGLGPLVAAILLLLFDWRSVALALSIPALLAAVFAHRARFDPEAAVTRPDETTPDATAGDAATDGGSKAESGVQSFSEFLTESKRLFAGSFVFVFLIVMFSGLYYRGVLTFLPELLRALPGFEAIPIADLLPGTVADLLGVDPADGETLEPSDYFYAGLLMIGVVGQYIGGKLTDRFPVEYGIAGAFGILAVLAVTFPIVSGMGLGPLAVFGVFLGVFLFVVQPLYQATVAEYTPPGTRGLSYGYTYLGVFGVGSLGAAVAGTVLAYADSTALFFVLAAFATSASLLGLYLARSR
ncbi:MFS family permease [Halalkaliarchaeum sp. AArc-CO]|nr:MFS family permease [Halalkaliarchaeum sp. AArc-CO]